MIDAHHDDVMVSGHVVTFEGDMSDCGAVREAAAVEPDHDRLLCVSIKRWGCDVQVQAIFAFGPEAMGDSQLKVRNRILQQRADMSVSHSCTNTFPRFRWDRHVEATGPSIPNAPEVEHIIIIEATKLTLPCLNNHGISSRSKIVLHSIVLL